MMNHSIPPLLIDIDYLHVYFLYCQDETTLSRLKCINMFFFRFYATCARDGVDTYHLLRIV